MFSLNPRVGQILKNNNDCGAKICKIIYSNGYLLLLIIILVLLIHLVISSILAKSSNLKKKIELSLACKLIPEFILKIGPQI